MATDLSKIILEARPKTSPSSIKAYIRLLKKLILSHPNIIDDPYDTTWVNDTEFNIKNIQSFGKGNEPPSEATIRNYCNVCMIYIEGIQGGKYNEPVWSELPEWQFYKNKVDTINENLKNKKEESSLTTSQESQFMDYKDFDNMLDILKKDCKKHLKNHFHLQDTFVTGDTYNDCMAFTLLSIYKELNIRNEVATLKFISKRQYNKMKKLNQANDNYIIVEKSKMTMIRNNYKTAENYKTLETELSKNLASVLRGWFKFIGLNGKVTFHNPGDENGLIIFPKLQPNENANTSTPELNLTKFLQRYTEKRFNKKISTTILTKIFMSRPENQTAKGIMNASKVRGTAPNTLVPSYANTLLNQLVEDHPNQLQVV